MLVRIAMLFVFTFVTSCSTSSMSRNLIKKGSFSLNGGVAEKVKWDDTLEFKRTSWFQELTLVYDLMLVKLDTKSVFANWFSEREREYVANCKNFYLTFGYSQEKLKVDHSHLKEALEAQGLVELAIPHFINQVRLHPDFEQFSLKHYRIKGFCAEKLEITKDIIVSFPGFMEQKID